jgi:hypothetical protein
MSTSDSPYQRGVSGATIAVMFTNRDTAKAALTELHEAGFRDVWLGVMHGDASTAAGATVAADEGGGMMKSLARFFSGEGAQEQALHQALFAHGLSDDQARRLEATVPAGAAIVTVSGENDVDEAIEILQRHGGTVAGDAMVSGTTAAATPTLADPGSKLNQTWTFRRFMKSCSFSAGPSPTEEQHRPARSTRLRKFAFLSRRNASTFRSERL